MSQYAELLKHPKWQEMRLRILERDGFECSYCGSGDKTLHVHHGYYERGKKPWEYDQQTLHSLCEECHEAEQEKLTDLHRIIGGLAPGSVDRVRGYAAGVEMGEYGNAGFDVVSHEMATGIAEAWGLTAEELIPAIPDGGIIDHWLLSELRRAKTVRSSTG